MESNPLNPHALTREDIIRQAALGQAAELLRHRGDTTHEDVVKAAAVYEQFLLGNR